MDIRQPRPRPETRSTPWWLDPGVECELCKSRHARGGEYRCSTCLGVVCATCVSVHDGRLVCSACRERR